ncbi:hypothetical protein OG898_28015 [Streptomyces sp. NBC_00193]|uniref:hypothetical protein n=1 Tax=Streptomyces sp. NBC_00193 TaxID=2975675 RepID=UPI00225B00EE|nr:hypothetical protein [Streptomyces sp. NBC_00193]MCX5300287.1 hypothetical protein [Streptomyces sp. NBC_00193]
MTDKAPQSDAPQGERLPLDRPATLTPTTTDGAITLTCSAGNMIQGTIPVVDGEGNLLAVYTAGPAPTPQTATTRSLEGETTVSGLSAGGAFAVQFHYAFTR